ncbi:hypothetical protein OUZ56_009172 [Daphnia magna]|uniref:Uncharacterized protein n=1 Tax=Daphnia magna TaxID=35525 RepID=A0ABR0AF78_9CRUS|nr:hypothetical protein OUZ56_009172 [Daphnia magna]
MDEDEEHSIVGCAIENTPENKIAMDEDEEHSIVGCAIKKSNAPEKNSPKSNFIENDKDGMADFIFKKHTKKKCQIRLPTNCKTCQMEKTGQCSSCAIVELKQQVREKDKQLITAKCYRTRSETHLKCLKLKLKENRKKLNTCRQKLLRMKRYGQEIVEELLEELSVRYVDVMDNQSSNDEVKHEMLYDMCGYLVKTRDSVWIHCPNCKKGLITKYEDLPSTFLSADYTADRNHGGLTFVTVKFF